MLQSVVALWDSRAIPYCILHGYQELPQRVASDVDCVLPASFIPRPVARLIQANRDRLGAGLVQWIQHQAGHYFILASAIAGTRREFLALDLCPAVRRASRVFYRAEEILASRRRYGGLWVPSPAIGFGCYLVRRIAKGFLDHDQARWLSDLFAEDPPGCEREIARFWRDDGAGLIREAAASGEWNRVQDALPRLRRELCRLTTVAALGGAARWQVSDAGRRIRRWRQPTGVHVVFLGPDGVGKSSVLAAGQRALMPAFWRVAPGHLGPGVLRRAQQRSSVAAPHDQPARSQLGSLAKAVYWLLDYTVGYYLKIRPALARSTLVLFDRYLLDALVDPRRYRYAGPESLLGLIWAVVPKPDLVLLLDAPADVVRARKPELSADELERQRRDYRALVKRLPNGCVIDAGQPLDQVAARVSQVVLDLLADRIGQHLGGAGSHAPPHTGDGVAATDSAGP